MTNELLIHSMSEFAAITLPILEAAQVKKICEIGSEHGGNTILLHEWLSSQEGHLTCIDPAPGPKFIEWLAKNIPHVRHIPAISLEAIGSLEPMDAWFVDGDHNWYTVYHELTLIKQVMEKNSKNTLIFLHDVSWPWARRDLYYHPASIPPAYCHPHDYRLGVTLESNALIQGGFRSEGAYACACHEGGKQNGVLTAIEDFIQQYPDDFYFAHIPAIFGLGIIFSREHPSKNVIAEIVSPYHENPILAKLERNRLANYLKVIELQDRLNELESFSTKGYQKDDRAPCES